MAWRIGSGMGRGIAEPRGENPVKSPPLCYTHVKEPFKLGVGIKRSNLMSGDTGETPAAQDVRCKCVRVLSDGRGSNETRHINLSTVGSLPPGL
jgi:hypothetical protein